MCITPKPKEGSKLRRSETSFLKKPPYAPPELRLFTAIRAINIGPLCGQEGTDIAESINLSTLTCLRFSDKSRSVNIKQFSRFEVILTGSN